MSSFILVIGLKSLNYIDLLKEIIINTTYIFDNSILKLSLLSKKLNLKNISLFIL